MEHTKEYKCPYCHMRSSATFEKKRSMRVKCDNCGQEFTIELNEFSRVNVNGKKKYSESAF